MPTACSGPWKKPALTLRNTKGEFTMREIGEICKLTDSMEKSEAFSLISAFTPKEIWHYYLTCEQDEKKAAAKALLRLKSLSKNLDGFEEIREELCSLLLTQKEPFLSLFLYIIKGYKTQKFLGVLKELYAKHRDIDIRIQVIECLACFSCVIAEQELLSHLGENDSDFDWIIIAQLQQNGTELSVKKIWPYLSSSKYSIREITFLTIIHICGRTKMNFKSEIISCAKREKSLWILDQIIDQIVKWPNLKPTALELLELLPRYFEDKTQKAKKKFPISLPFAIIESYLKDLTKNEKQELATFLGSNIDRLTSEEQKDANAILERLN